MGYLTIVIIGALVILAMSIITGIIYYFLAPDDTLPTPPEPPVVTQPVVTPVTPETQPVVTPVTPETQPVTQPAVTPETPVTQPVTPETQPVTQPAVTPETQPVTQPVPETTPTPVPAACGNNQSCISYTTLASSGDVAGYNSRTYSNTSLQSCQDLCTQKKCTWLSWGDNNCILKNAPASSGTTNIFNTVGDNTCTYITPGTYVTGDQTHSRDKNSLSDCNNYCNENPNDCDFAMWDEPNKMCYTYDTKENTGNGYVSYFPVGAVCSSAWGQ